MEISNSVLQSLSGFKDLYGSMDDFLQITSQEARDKLYGDIKTQQSTLNATLKQIGDNGGRDNLVAATDGTSGIADTVSKLWTLHEQELALRKSIDDAQKVMITSRFNVNYDAQQLEENIRKDEGNATATLRAADRLLKGGDTLATVMSDFNKAQLPADKLKVVTDAIPAITKAQRLIEISVPQNQKSMTQSLSQTISDVKAQATAADAGTDEAIANLGRLVSRFRQMSTYTQLTATQMMREATTTFVALDSRIAQTNSVLEDTRRLESAIYSLQLVFGEFAAKPSKENRVRLHQEIATLGTNLNTLLASAKGMNFAEDIVAAMSPALASMDKDALRPRRYDQPARCRLRLRPPAARCRLGSADDLCRTAEADGRRRAHAGERHFGTDDRPRHSGFDHRRYRPGSDAAASDRPDHRRDAPHCRRRARYQHLGRSAPR